jgi:hypothetical protein
VEWSLVWAASGRATAAQRTAISENCFMETSGLVALLWRAAA